MTFLARGVRPISPTHRPIAAPDDELDRAADLGQLDAQVLEHACGHAVALADEPEQQVLGADVVVVEALRFFLRERQDLACPLSELVESIHPRRVSPPGAPPSAR